MSFDKSMAEIVEEIALYYGKKMNKLMREDMVEITGGRIPRSVLTTLSNAVPPGTLYGTCINCNQLAHVDGPGICFGCYYRGINSMTIPMTPATPPVNNPGIPTPGAYTFTVTCANCRFQSPNCIIDPTYGPLCPRCYPGLRGAVVNPLSYPTASVASDTSKLRSGSAKGRCLHESPRMEIKGSRRVVSCSRLKDHLGSHVAYEAHHEEGGVKLAEWEGE